MSHPFTPTYIDKQQARLELALPATPLWDAVGDAATLLPLFVCGAQSVTITFRYTSGVDQGKLGAFDFKLLVCPNNPVVRWYQTTLYSPTMLVTGVDVDSLEQREYITYGATQAVDPETFVYGPYPLGEAAEWIFIASRESGIPLVPGTLRVDIDLDWEEGCISDQHHLTVTPPR
jgi:hypothetical protein